MASDLQAAVERLTAWQEFAEEIDDDLIRTGQMNFKAIKADVLLVLSRLAALEREVKAWREFVPAFSEQEPGWSDKMVEVAAARAATDAINGKRCCFYRRHR